MSDQPAEKQPLVTRRLALRAALLLFLIAILILGFQWFLQKGSDIGGLGVTDTAGFIAALELQAGGGARAVVIKPDGAVTASPDYQAGSTDRDIVWRPDGNQLFFTSDRDGKAYNIYRWNLAKGQDGLVEPRTKGTIAWSAPSFPMDAGEESKNLVLCISAGSVWERNAADLTGQKLIPFARERNIDIDRAAESGDTGEAQGLGIRRAAWAKDKTWLIAVRRTETGEALLIQPMNVEERERVPHTLAVGDKIDFDVNAATGKVAFSIQGFQWPDPSKIPKEFIKNGRAKRPYQHSVAMFDPSQSSKPIPLAISPDRNMAYGPPAFSPDGSAIAITTGTYEDGTFTPSALNVVPTDNPRAGYRLASGEIYEPSWSPDSSTIIFAKRVNGSRGIFSIGKRGVSETRVTAADRNYSSPRFSPQAK